MPSAKHISYLVVRKPSKKLNSAVKVVLLDQLLERTHSWAISSNDKVDVLELGKDLWDDWDKEINTFSVLEP